jgi:hypothetical protein
MLNLEMSVVRELLSREEIPGPEISSDTLAMATGETTAKLFSVCCRLLELLEQLQDIPFLSGLIQREITYRILQAPAGARLRAIATGRSKPAYGKSDGVDQGELREAATAGRTGTNPGHGRLDTPQPFHGVDGHESSSVPQAVKVADRPGSHAHGWAQRGKRGGQIRKRHPRI